MNKGTARILRNITQFPGKAVAETGHNLGIAAKPVAKTTKVKKTCAKKATTAKKTTTKKTTTAKKTTKKATK